MQSDTRNIKIRRRTSRDISLTGTSKVAKRCFSTVLRHCMMYKVNRNRLIGYSRSRLQLNQVVGNANALLMSLFQDEFHKFL
jgi:hypothetical protein